MSFSFSFSGDDIEEDPTSDSISSDHNNVSNPTDSLASKLQDTTLSHSLISPKWHTLAELLTGLPSQISYNYLEIPSHFPTNSSAGNGANRSDEGTTSKKIRIPRRSLFDIRQQLMAESDPANTNDQTGNLLSGLETGDLSSGIYEGGFKTWECAVDLAGFVSGMLDRSDSTPVHVIELGAGSAVPTLVLLANLLRARLSKGTEFEQGKVTFTLCDYNEDVLRLGTALNVFLLTLVAVKEEGALQGDEEEGDIEVNEDDVQVVLRNLEDINVEVNLVSGAWGEDFVRIVQRARPDENAKLLLLASETIYSPGSLHVFSQTVLDILKSTSAEKRALIAAKKVYFGVGGGVQEFEDEVRTLGGRIKPVLDVKSAGVGRVILELSAN